MFKPEYDVTISIEHKRNGFHTLSFYWAVFPPKDVQIMLGCFLTNSAFIRKVVEAMGATLVIITPALTRNEVKLLANEIVESMVEKGFSARVIEDTPEMEAPQVAHFLIR